MVSRQEDYRMCFRRFPPTCQETASGRRPSTMEKYCRMGEYFSEGRRLYEIAVRRTQRAVPFAKPMATFKLHQFGITCGDLVGFFARRNRHRLPGKAQPIQPFNVTAVFDSDIQGHANQQVCKDVFDRAMPEIKRTPRHLRISPPIRAEIKTEQEEPLLLLADYLAGYHYSRVGLSYSKG